MFPDLLRDDVFRLETARLWLRWPRAGDVASLVRYGGEEAVAKMTASMPHPYRVEDAAKWIFASRVGNAQGGAIALVLTHKRRPGEAIGAIGLHRLRDKTALMGYWLGLPHQGRGLMSEAAEGLIALAFQLGGVDEIEAQTRVENVASKRVLEKCGFRSHGRGPVDLPARGGLVVCERFKLAREAAGLPEAPQAPPPRQAIAG